MEERDYDKNPTQLYTSLQSLKWEDVIKRIETNPEEAKIWIYRTEVDGIGLRWRLLPIHASIIFKAPVEVVESVITVYSEAAKQCDDQQSLPIHLAYKRGASASTYRVLLDAYPGSIDVKDAKGRTPRDLAKAGSGPRHVEFVYALKVHMASRKLAREEARTEEEKKFAMKLQDAQKTHQEQLEAMRQKNHEEIEKMENKIKNLEHDVELSQSVSKTLNKDLAELQAKLKQHQDSEADLTRRLSERNVEVEESCRVKSTNEEELELELKRLSGQIADTKQNISKLLFEKEILSKSLESVVESTEWEKQKLEKKIEEQRRTIEALQFVAQKTEAEKEELQVKLEKKEEEERNLNETIENLETQLKTWNTNANELAETTKNQIENLESERDVLKESNNRMSSQLQSVATFLGDMKEEQVAIVDQAAEHEKEMEAVAKEHVRILSEIEEQQKQDMEAQQQRLLLAALIQAQEEEMARNVKARQMIQEAITVQSNRIERAAMHRQDLVTNAQKVRIKVEARLSAVMPTTSGKPLEDGDSLHDVAASSSHASFYLTQSSVIGDLDQGGTTIDQKSEISSTEAAQPAN